jgi:hypothetical protein
VDPSKNLIIDARKHSIKKAGEADEEQKYIPH